MRVVVCALAKNEHLYINEWVKHYLKLGFDKLFIFDNDDKESPHIKDYIDKNDLDKIRIINARGYHKNGMQGEFYTNFYNIECHNFDWCLFCDIDEFLVGVDNVKDFLSKPRFRYVQQIRVKWRLFGDNELIERDMNKSVMETFTKETYRTLSPDLQNEVKLYNQAKSFVHGGLTNVCFTSVHYANNERTMRILPSILPSGRVCNSGVELKEDYSNETIFLNHYMTKSLSEFIKQKINRGDAVFGDRKINMNYYWRINTKTDEKIKYLKDLGLE